MNSSNEHEHCIKCGRKLYCSTSRIRGYGWGCWRRIRAAAKAEALATRLAQFTRRQLDQATEVLELAAIVTTAIAGVFHVVSTDGAEIYETTCGSCNCPAAKPCYHMLAACLVSA